jgi:hypothetical protein
VVEPGSIATPIWERGQAEVDARGQALAKKLLPTRLLDWLVARATGT